MKSIIFSLLLLCCVLSLNGYSQDKENNRNKYFVIMRDSTSFIGVITKIDHETKTITLLTSLDKEITINIREILYQKKIKDESEIELLKEFESFNKKPITKTLKLLYNKSKSAYSSFVGLTKPYILGNYIVENSAFALTESKIYVLSKNSMDEFLEEYFDFMDYDKIYRVGNDTKLANNSFDISFGFNPHKNIGLQIDWLSASDVNMKNVYEWPYPIDFVTYYSVITLQIEQTAILPSIRLSKNLFYDSFEVYARFGVFLCNTTYDMELTHELYNNLYLGGYSNKKTISLDNHKFYTKDLNIGFGFAYNVFKNIAINTEISYMDSKDIRFIASLTQNSIMPIYRDNNEIETIAHVDDTLENSNFRYVINNTNLRFKIGLCLSL